MAVVTELVTVFSFKGSLGKLDRFRGGVKSSLKLLSGFAVGTAAAASGLVALTSASLKSADAVGQLSKETGDSVELLQQYGFAASVSASSTDALNSSVSNLSAKIGEAAQNGSEEFSRLGINMRNSNGEVKTSLQVIEDLRTRFKQLGLSLQEQRKFTDALGIDKSLLQLLNKTSSEMALLKKRASDIGVLTKEETQRAIDYNDSLTVLRFGSKALQQQFSLALVPEMKRLAEWFTDLTSGSDTLIKDGFKNIISVAGGVVDAIIRVSSFISDVIDVTIGWKVAIGLIVAAVLTILSPLQLIIAGIVAVIAVVDDLIVAFRGGKSVIRDFFLEFLGWDITPFLKRFVQSFRNVITMIKNMFVELFGFVGRGFNQIADFFGFGGSAQSPTTLQPMASHSRGGGNQTSISQDVRINVETNDPELAGRSINQALQNEYRAATQQTGLGGR